MRLNVVAVLMLTAASAPVSGKAQCPREAGDYQVRFNGASPMEAEVSAFLRLAGGRLRMSTGASDHLPERWATFVHNLEVRDRYDRVLPIVRDTVAGWQVDATNGCVRVSYRVDLRHAREKWPPGNEQGAYLADGSLYMVSKALFVYSPVAGDRRIRVHVPPGVRVEAPWRRDSAGVFRAPSLASLIDNSLVIGQPFFFTVENGGSAVEVVLLGDAAKDSALVRASLEPAVRELAGLFETPLAGRYLMTIFYGDEDDGEAFAESAAFRTLGPLKADNRILWANTLVHELFHYWNGHRIRFADYATSQWFVEGVTEYYANRALVRNGIITTDDFLKMAGLRMAHYRYFRTAAAYDSVSLARAGSRKSTYRFGVYDGGWAVAFWLDQRIRDLTNDTRNLDDVLRRLNRDYAMADKPVGYADVIDVVSQVTGRSVADEFAWYVTGTRMLPLESSLQALGLAGHTRDYAAEAYITIDPSASFAQRSRRQRTFGF